MRLEAKIKSGFYPLQTRWIEPIAARIKCSPKATLFDPCCGTGEAVHLLGKSLGLHENNVYGSELDERRSEQAAKLLAPGKVTGNVDFLGSSAWGEASVVYCNPPFDDELGGGGRVEWRFAINAISCLKVGGVFVGIFPDRVAVSSEMYQVLSQKLERILCFELPGERPYEECVIFGTKLKTEIPSQYRRAIARDWDDWSDFPYDAPDGGPVHVRKHFYTDQEMEVLAGKSPANSLLVSKAKASRTEFAPPMALTRGHVALLLASGCLDGVVALPGEQPHVVRGSSRKVIQEKQVKDGGAVKVYRTEQIKLTIKTASAEGVFEMTSAIENEVPEEDEEPETEEDDNDD